MKRGVSIIGAVFTLLILSIFGAAIVALVSTDHEIRRMQVFKGQTFYEIQAGLEYAIREINQGGYPAVTKNLGIGSFTNTIDYSQHAITTTAVTGDVTHANSITYSPMGGDCLDINTSSVSTEGLGGTDLVGIFFTKTCLSAVTLDKMVFTWSPNGGEKITRIEIDSTAVYRNASGTASGLTIDINDFMIADALQHRMNLVRFTSDTRGKQMALTVYLSDTSYKSVNFTVP